MDHQLALPRLEAVYLADVALREPFIGMAADGYERVPGHVVGHHIGMDAVHAFAFLGLIGRGW